MLGLHLNSAPTFPGVILFDGFLGCSVHFTPSLGRLRDGLVEAFIIAREQRVPEMYIWVNEVRPFRSGYLCSGATFLCMVHSTFCQFSFCLESLILIDCLLICRGFCKMCHFLTPYLLVWHLIGLKGCGLRNPAKSCQRSDRLNYLGILEASAVRCFCWSDVVGLPLRVSGSCVCGKDV